MLHALLIDDEASARADLREKLLAHPGVTIVGEAATLSAARALLASVDYNLVFLDVQLIGGLSFDLVPCVRPGASIVFATAHEGYALRAFEGQAIDYLLKPIAPARLAEALRRAAGALVPARNPAAPDVAADVSPARTTTLTPFVFQSPHATAETAAEVPLTRDESTFLRQMIEAWEDTLHPTHVLQVKRDGLRTIRYQRNAEPTRIFLAGAPASALRRWWRAFRA